MDKTKLTNTILPFIGLVDAMYLMRIRNDPGICHVQETGFNFNIDCGAVATSQYSTILGIPLALLGMLYYITLIILFTSDLTRTFTIAQREVSLWQLTIGLLAIAFLFSLYLVFLQMFVIESICLYCMTSALVTTILFIFNLILYLRSD